MSDAGGLVVVGANHRSGSLSLRDRLFVDDAQVADFLKNLNLPQAVILSTCDRVEIWAWDHAAVPDAEVPAADVPAADVADAAAAALEARGGGGRSAFYTYRGEAALRHMFAVTASLDSLVLGEPQVPGQVRAAAKLAREAGTVGPQLEAALQAAQGAAKRVRSDTAIGEGPVSIAAAACELARDLHGDLSQRQGLLIGAGDMGELVAESLMAAGLARIEIMAPRASRAEALAEALDGYVVAFDQLVDALPKADVVLVAVGGRHVTLTAEMVGKAIKKRRRRPVFMIDCGIPGDVEPAVNRLDGAFLYDMADLERVALKSRSSREQAAVTAWAIIEQEVEAYVKGRMALAAVPAIVALRQHLDEMRQTVLAEVGDDAERATQLLVNRLAHAPSEVLKQAAASGGAWEHLEDALKKLFRLG